MKTWILVSDAASAKVFSSSGNPAQLTLVQKMARPASRSKDADRFTDRPGRSRKHRGESRAFSMPSPTSPKEHEAQRFAKELKTTLTSGLREHRFDALALVAPAHFLGTLSKRLGAQLRDRVLIRMSRDFTHSDVRAVRQQLRDVFDTISAEERRRAQALRSANAYSGHRRLRSDGMGGENKTSD